MVDPIGDNPEQMLAITRQKYSKHGENCSDSHAQLFKVRKDFPSIILCTSTL